MAFIKRLRTRRGRQEADAPFFEETPPPAPRARPFTAAEEAESLARWQRAKGRLSAPLMPTGGELTTLGVLAGALLGLGAVERGIRLDNEVSAATTPDAPLGLREALHGSVAFLPDAFAHDGWRLPTTRPDPLPEMVAEEPGHAPIRMATGSGGLPPAPREAERLASGADRSESAAAAGDTVRTAEVTIAGTEPVIRTATAVAIGEPDAAPAQPPPSARAPSPADTRPSTATESGTVAGEARPTEPPTTNDAAAGVPTGTASPRPAVPNGERANPASPVADTAPPSAPDPVLPVAEASPEPGAPTNQAESPAPAPLPVQVAEAVVPGLIDRPAWRGEDGPAAGGTAEAPSPATPDTSPQAGPGAAPLPVVDAVVDAVKDTLAGKPDGVGHGHGKGATPPGQVAEAPGPATPDAPLPVVAVADAVKDMLAGKPDGVGHGHGKDATPPGQLADAPAPATPDAPPHAGDTLLPVVDAVPDAVADALPGTPDSSGDAGTEPAPLETFAEAPSPAPAPPVADPVMDAIAVATAQDADPALPAPLVEAVLAALDGAAGGAPADPVPGDNTAEPDAGAAPAIILDAADADGLLAYAPPADDPGGADEVPVLLALEAGPETDPLLLAPGLLPVELTLAAPPILDALL